MPLSAANNICKKFGARTGLANCGLVGPDPNPNCLTLMVFMKDFLKTRKKKCAKIKKRMQSYPVHTELREAIQTDICLELCLMNCFSLLMFEKGKHVIYNVQGLW